jgi:asparagine synthase (glutamine-hydrolysing)
MCGIAGIANHTDQNVDPDLIDRMVVSLGHRGPDDKGTHVDGPLGFGFCRLAILDRSPAGHQPMQSADGNLWIVFNGEIYNYLELKKGLEAEGFTFRGGSDTEVLLALYQQKGPHCLKEINGMFAFAIYSTRDKTLFLARDRFGKKPLFYWLKPAGGLAFASELRALRLMPGFPTQVDPIALKCFLHLGFVPNSECIYTGIKKLPPGCWMQYRADLGTVTGPRTYWELPPPREEPGLSESEWLDRIEHMLRDAVRIRLRSDVPLAVFLSGGIDSGLVAACAAQSTPGLAALTISFPGDGIDESNLASATGSHLRVRHVIRRVQLKEGKGLLPEIMGHFDEPFADSSAVPTSLVCAAARKEFTVVLSGDGGDEVFAGYRNSVRAWRWRWLAAIPQPLRRAVSAVASHVTVRDSAPRRFLNRLPHAVGIFGVGGHCYPFGDWMEKCIRPEWRISPTKLSHQVMGKPLAHSSPVDEAQRCDVRLYMLDDILVKIDRMSMSHALEVRSPFLDHRLVELAFTIPTPLRVRGGVNKYLLRRLSERHLPGAVSTAKKSGFGLPLRAWLYDSTTRNDFRTLLQEAHPSFPDPFLPGGPDRLFKAAEKNPTLDNAVFQMLAYRWWCLAQ